MCDLSYIDIGDPVADPTTLHAGYSFPLALYLPSVSTKQAVNCLLEFEKRPIFLSPGAKRFISHEIFRLDSDSVKALIHKFHDDFDSWVWCETKNETIEEKIQLWLDPKISEKERTILDIPPQSLVRAATIQNLQSVLCAFEDKAEWFFSFDYREAQLAQWAGIKTAPIAL